MFGVEFAQVGQVKPELVKAKKQPKNKILRNLSGVGGGGLKLTAGISGLGVMGDYRGKIKE